MSEIIKVKNMLLCFIILILIIFGLNFVFIEDSFAEPANDMAIYMESLSTLPDFCRYRLAEAKFRREFTSSNGRITWLAKFAKSADKWERIIGSQNWVHVHHYCFGIKAIMDYATMSTADKSRNKERQMERALREFQYMKNAKTYNFPLWHDLYNYEAYAYMRLDKPKKAEQSLKNSLRYKVKK